MADLHSHKQTANLKRNVFGARQWKITIVDGQNVLSCIATTQVNSFDPNDLIECVRMSCCCFSEANGTPICEKRIEHSNTPNTPTPNTTQNTTQNTTNMKTNFIDDVLFEFIKHVRIVSCKQRQTKRRRVISTMNRTTQHSTKQNKEKRIEEKRREETAESYERDDVLE